MTPTASAPTTRRELRLAEQRARGIRRHLGRVPGAGRTSGPPPPSVAARSVSPWTALPTAGRPPSNATGPTSRRALRRDARRASRSRFTAPLATAMIAILAAAGVVDVHHARAERAAAEQHELAQAVAEQQRRDRVDLATAARLGGQAARYTAGLLDEALTDAQHALESADAVVVATSPVVDVPTLTPLDRAIAELSDAIDRSPDPRTLTAADGTLLAQAAGRREELVAATDTLKALSSQVQAVADANAAAAQAAAASVAVTEAVVAELATRIDRAATAPNGQIPVDALCGVGFDTRVLLRCDAAVALEQLNTAYRHAHGTDLRVVSSYRDLATQVATRESRGALAATAGTSVHGLGRAVDFGNMGGLGDFGTATYRWLSANAATYGWSHPAHLGPGGGGPPEPWHWEYGTS